MPKTILLALTLLLSAAWVQAQSEYPQTTPSQSGTTAADTSGPTTVQGCLRESNGNYTLTSDSGTTYQLQGESSELREHVGHEVEIKGTLAGSAATPSAGTETNPGASTSPGVSNNTQNSLHVEGVKHISKTCTGSSK